MADFSSQINVIASTYSTDTIFILGKGPSAGAFPKELFKDSLVIGINDAERIHPCDITIFHADWVKAALEDSGPTSELYLTSTDYQPSAGKVVRAPHLSLEQESSDLMMQRLMSGEFVIEDILFLSALKIALEVARLRGRPQKVYMVGFDFTPNAGFADIRGPHYETGNKQDRRLIFAMQENYLLNALYMLHGSAIDLVHVGDRNYSNITAEGLVHELLPSTDIDGGEGQSDVVVTAEITTNHFGDRQRLEHIVRAAKAAGADFVKVQKRDVETFYSEEQLASPYKSPFGTTFREYRNQLELSGEDFEFLDALCKRLGIRWFASILDVPSYEFIRDFKPDLVKLPSTISEHLDYLEMVSNVADHGIVLSTGMTDKTFENWVLDKFSDIPCLYLMQANSAYPSPARDCNVAVVRHYHSLAQKYPHIIPAYSSHDEGWFGSTLAIAAGARMVEKHVKLGNTDWAHFDAVALDLTTPEFRKYVNKMREAEIILGSEEKKVAPSEHHKYRR